MQRTSRRARSKVSTAMRRSMLRLEQKARWLHPLARSIPKAVTRSRQKAASTRPKTKALPTAVKEHKETLNHLDAIAAELADWLNPQSARKRPKGEGVNVADIDTRRE